MYFNKLSEHNGRIRDATRNQQSSDNLCSYNLLSLTGSYCTYYIHPLLAIHSLQSIKQ